MRRALVRSRETEIPRYRSCPEALTNSVSCRKPPVSSTKSSHGHCLGASGAVELIACVHAVTDAVVAPTTNLDEPDDGFDLDFVPHDARERPVRHAMNNTFGFGGHNVTLIVGRYDG